MKEREKERERGGAFDRWSKLNPLDEIDENRKASQARKSYSKRRARFIRIRNALHGIADIFHRAFPEAKLVILLCCLRSGCLLAVRCTARCPPRADRASYVKVRATLVARDSFANRTYIRPLARPSFSIARLLGFGKKSAGKQPIRGRWSTRGPIAGAGAWSNLTPFTALLRLRPIISVQSAVISNGRLSLSNDDFSRYRGKTSPGIDGTPRPGLHEAQTRGIEVSRCCYIVARDDICGC